MRYLGHKIDFRNPANSPALVPADGVSWRIFKNPVALLVGGIAAVLLELAHPRVRAGVWNHSSFEKRPFRRISRTGLAAMITVYAPAETARKVITGVTDLHRDVRGTLENGTTYAALDPELLNWVQATASFGFLSAYSTFVRPVPALLADRFLDEAVVPSRLYGATHLPLTRSDQYAYLLAHRDQLETSPVIGVFLDRLKRALPWPAAQMAIPCAISLLPDELIGDLNLLHLLPQPSLRDRMNWLGKVADRVSLPVSPPYQAMRRMGLLTRNLYGAHWWDEHALQS